MVTPCSCSCSCSSSTPNSFHGGPLPQLRPRSSRTSPRFCFFPSTPSSSSSSSSSSADEWTKRDRSSGRNSGHNGIPLRGTFARCRKTLSILSSSASEHLESEELSSPLEAFCCRNSQFLESSDDGKIRSIIEAGAPSTSIPSEEDYSSSSILVILGNEAFVDHIFKKFPGMPVEVVHFSLEVLSSIKEKHDEAKCFYISTTDFSEISGSFDTIFLNYFPIFSKSLSTILKDAAKHCKPGGNVVISLGQGKTILDSLKDHSQALLQSFLPNKDELIKMVSTLPLELINFQDMPNFYLAALKFNGADHRGIKADVKHIASSKEKHFPLYATGNVIHGFGRGSKQLGFPTANLSVDSLPLSITKLTNGVYYGCAQIIGSGIDSGIYRMVMNIGNRPTFQNGHNISLEVHIVHDYEGDFYGKELRIAVLGFIREEMRFSSVDQLIKRIKKDVEFMQTHLSAIDFETQKRSSFFCNLKIKMHAMILKPSIVYIHNCCERKYLEI